MRSTVILTLLALTACSNQVEMTTKNAQPAAMSEYTLHDYAGALTAQLLRNTNKELQHGIVVVNKFTLLEDHSVSMSSDAAPQLGRQLQHSMQTLLTSAGFSVVPFNGVNRPISSEHNSFKANDDYPASVNVDYVLNGTLTQQQHAYIVNSQLVDMTTHHIVAAATTEIPLNVLWSRDQVQLRNGRLYRIEQQGAGQ